MNLTPKHQHDDQVIFAREDGQKDATNEDDALKSWKILVVDDEKDVELLFKQKFRREVKSNALDHDDQLAHSAL